MKIVDLTEGQNKNNYANLKRESEILKLTAGDFVIKTI